MRALRTLTATALMLAPLLLAPSLASAAGPACDGASATIVGTAGRDRLVGTPGRDVLVGRGGHDVLLGRGGDDVVCGGAGADRIIGGSGRDVLRGGPGADVVQDRLGLFDVLAGGPGDDWIRSTARNAVAEADEKRLEGGPGADRIVSGNASSDTLLGGRGPDGLVGLGLNVGGVDIFVGQQGRDVLGGNRVGVVTYRLTGDGDMVYAPYPQEDGAFPQSGVRLMYRSAPGPVEVDLGLGVGAVLGSPRRDVFVDDLALLDFIMVVGTPSADRLLGTVAADTLFGEEGDDLLDGREGEDSLWAGRGDDHLDGGAGGDTGDGGLGANTCLNLEHASRCEPGTAN